MRRDSRNISEIVLIWPPSDWADMESKGKEVEMNVRFWENYTAMVPIIEKMDCRNEKRWLELSQAEEKVNELVHLTH